MHLAYLAAQILIHPACKPEITLLLAIKISVPNKYTEYLDVFSKKSAVVLHNWLNINKYVINLELGKQPPYGPIYNLAAVMLKTLNTYTRTNLANKFIPPSKFPARAPISFLQKSTRSVHLYIDYWGVNNLTIKNWYLLLLIGELLD